MSVQRSIGIQAEDENVAVQSPDRDDLPEAVDRDVLDGHAAVVANGDGRSLPPTPNPLSSDPLAFSRATTAALPTRPPMTIFLPAAPAPVATRCRCRDRSRPFRPCQNLHRECQLVRYRATAKPSLAHSPSSWSSPFPGPRSCRPACKATRYAISSSLVLAKVVRTNPVPPKARVQARAVSAVANDGEPGHAFGSRPSAAGDDDLAVGLHGEVPRHVVSARRRSLV